MRHALGGVISAAVGALAVMVLLPALPARTARAGGGPLSIESSEVTEVENGVLITLSGKADLPDGALVVGSISLAGRAGVHKRGPVSEGRFSLEFGPLERRVLPGTYDVKVSYELRGQPREVRKAMRGKPKPPAAEDVLKVGKPSAAKKERKALKKRYQALFDDARRVRGLVVQLGSQKDLKPELWQEQSKSKAHGEIEAYAKALTELKEEIFLSYFPEAQDGLENLAYLLPRLNAAYGISVFEAAGKEAPADLIALREFGLTDGHLRMRQHAERVEAALGVKAGTWDGKKK